MLWLHWSPRAGTNNSRHKEEKELEEVNPTLCLKVFDCPVASSRMLVERTDSEGHREFESAQVVEYYDWRLYW